VGSVRQKAIFAEWFKPDEVRVVVVDGSDVGWIQLRARDETVFLGSIYITPGMQRKGIGTRVIQMILDSARQQNQFVTLGVMKINPALALYTKLGFRVTHEDEHKLYLRWAPLPP
jgi:ribosomal protein S18 acetylase RimI-like enzyme